MPYKKLIFTTTLLCLSFGSALAQENAQALFASKCASCHVTTPPADFSKLTAPPIMGVMRHVKMHHKSKEAAVAFIVDYTLNPQEEKALCTTDKIKHFGLMPSQRGNVTQEELQRIAGWMYDNFPAASSSKKQCGTQQARQATPSPKAAPSQFLIASGMPHMTKLLMQQWDDSTLALTPDQKKKLLRVRQQTMQAVKRITPRIRGLQKTIIRKTMAGESPNTLEPMVKKLGQLKAQATNVHVQCIHDTKNILTEKQMAYLYR